MSSPSIELVSGYRKTDQSNDFLMVLIRAAQLSTVCVRVSNDGGRMWINEQGVTGFIKNEPGQEPRGLELEGSPEVSHH